MDIRFIRLTRVIGVFYFYEFTFVGLSRSLRTFLVISAFRVRSIVYLIALELAG